MNTSLQNKPSLFTAIAIMTLVNGIFNLIYGVGLIAGTFGIALLCGIALLPIVLGGFEIAYAMRLFSNPPQSANPSYAIAWWEIAAALSGNLLSPVVGILALIFYNDSTVKDYFARLNAPQTPPPPANDPVTVVEAASEPSHQDSPEPAAPSLVESMPEPVAAPAPVDEVPAWLKSEEAASTEAPAAPEETEAKPAKKKSPAKPRAPRKPSTKK